jgi:hypothetical protein
MKTIKNLATGCISAPQAAQFEVIRPVFNYRTHLTTLYGSHRQDF